MNVNYKKLILVAGFILLCLALIFAMYWLFFRTIPDDGLVDDVPGGGTGQLPDTGAGDGSPQLGGGGQLPGTGDVTVDGLDDGTGDVADAPAEPTTVARGSDTYVLPLTENRVKAVSLSTTGQGVNYWDSESNKFYKISADGSSRLPLSDEKFFSVEDVSWSSDSTKAIITYPDGSNVFYDFSTKQKVTLPKQVKEPVFSSGSDSIGFKYETENVDDSFIAVSNPDGTGAKYLEPMGDESNKVQVGFSPDETIVALYGKPSSLGTSEVYLIGQEGENFKSLPVEGSNFKAMWSPSGRKMVYQVTMAENGYRPSLWVIDGGVSNIGGHKFSLGVMSWVDKCVFENELSLICAVPNSIPEGSGLYEDVETSEDEVYRIDLSTGSRSKIANPVIEKGVGNFSMYELQISSDQKYLFFWDRVTSQVYSMQIK